ncbi:MAG TPA: 1,4-alpha-glucan branching enzyme, partial [Polyangia bacterium]|nr:1,4-alpha-glucan branching enzyme [Polyangia bacterium]
MTLDAEGAAPEFGDVDLHLFAEGTHGRLYEKLGAHPVATGDRRGTTFAVWAPNAEAVDVIGDFNDWTPGRAPLHPVRGSGVWSGFVADAGPGSRYKFHLRSRFGGYTVAKADPFAFATEAPPGTASVVATLDHVWTDDAWMRGRRARNALDAPISIYELHLGSWLRDPARPTELLSYRAIAPRLVEHVRRAGFTHV